VSRSLVCPAASFIIVIDVNPLRAWMARMDYSESKERSDLPAVKTAGKLGNFNILGWSIPRGNELFARETE